MKKILLLAAAIIAACAMQAQNADELRIYLNPGHGSFGPNDRPLSTVNHPNTSSLSDPDSLGFYEGRGTLQRAFGIAKYLKQVGFKSENIVFSRLANGPWPYVAGAEDAEVYNRPLAEICEEVEAGNFDMFLSDHSNANVDGDMVNYPLALYRGYDQGQTGDAGYNGEAVPGSYAMADAVWDTHYMNELDPQSAYSRTNKNIRGDINFYGSYSTATRSNGNRYSGYLGVLKHGVPGFLFEAFFHTYQPARHRALNFDYDRQEGRREARGIVHYFGVPGLNTGDIMGHVRDLHEKFSHTYYKPMAGTDDALLPLNGAEVKLYRGNEIVASYTVDNEYNGIFVFEDLEPGEYMIGATLDGYKVMDELVAVTVTADQTAYAKIYLENEAYEPPTEVYENYPEPDQPGYLKLADEFVFDKSAQALDLVGTIKDAVQLGDSTVVLTNDGKTPHLYLVKTSTKEMIKELSTEGIYTEDTPGFFSALNAINRTADNKLVGVSLTENQFNADYVADGYARGTARVYIWNDIDGAPALFASTTNSGNYYNANVGHSILVNGPSTGECEVIVTAMTTGSTCNIRLVHISMVDGEQSSVFYDNLYSDGFVGKQDAYGEELRLMVSPNGDDKTILGGKGVISEFVTPVSNAGRPSDIKLLSDEFGVTGVGFQCFKYAGHNLLVTPYAVDGVVKGIKILDITDGIDQAKLIKTVNTDIDVVTGAPSKATHHDPILNGLTQNIATAVVDGEDIQAALVGADALNIFTTKGVDQPVVKGIYAYDLNKTEQDEEYTFTFSANDDAVSGTLIFTDRETGQVLGEYPLTDITEGENTVTLNRDQIPGEEGQTIDWAVNLQGNTIPTFGLINDPNDFNYTYTFNTVDKNPESLYFGRIYVGHRPGTSSAENGLWIYNPDYTRVNDAVINTRSDGNTFRSNYRLAIDPEGKVYMPDWGDPTSGVYVFDPANQEAGFKPFFANEDGSLLSRDGNGMLTNAEGVAVGGSVPGLHIVGTGADTKMFVYNEDIVVNGSGNNVSVYNIGNDDGTLATYWNQAPDATYAIGAYEANGNGNVWGRPDGSCWVAQYRSTGNNTRGVPSLLFVDPQGNITYNSGADVDFAATYMNGSAMGGFAMSDDESTFVVCDGSGTLQFYGLEIADNTPSLTPLYSFKPTEALRSGGLYQINFDYAGNLICSGAKVGIYSIPTEDNQSTTPARDELAIVKPSVTSVNDVEVSRHVKAVRYVNPAGQQSNRPFDGVNIVITTYDDGTQKTTKVVR